MSSAVVRSALACLCTVTALMVQSPLVHAQVVTAASVTANDATYTFALPQTSGDMVTISLNVTENMDINGGPLVSGSPRPVQLASASSSDAVMVSKFRNCIIVSFVAPGPTTFSVDYTVADGRNPGLPTIDAGKITFVGSSTQSYVASVDPNCSDSGFLPTASDDTAQTVAGQQIGIPVQDNDSPGHVIFAPGSADNDVFQVTTTGGGTAVAMPDNTIQYLPAAGFTGTDTFTYIVESYSQPGFEGLNPVANVTVNVLPNTQSPQPLANALLVVNGGSTAIVDSDSKPGEMVQFAVQETVPGELADIVNYDWFVGEETIARQSGTSPMFSVLLPDGFTFVRVVATDAMTNTGALQTSVTIAAPTSQVLANAQLLVNGGGSRALLDTDFKPGENVQFSVQETMPGGLSNIVNFNWFVNSDPAPRQSGSSTSFTVALPDGPNTVWVVGTDTNGMIGQLTASIAIASPPPSIPVLANAQLLVNGGTATSLADGDQAPGESVQFSVQETVTGELGDIATYAWYVNGEAEPRQISPSASFTVTLADGASTIRVIATDTSMNSGQLSLNVSIAAPTRSPPLMNVQLQVNGGTVTSITDTDQQPGENVTFAVKETVGGTLANIVSYDWFVDQESTSRQSGPSSTFTAKLPDGQSLVSVIATDGQGNSNSLSITVAVGSPVTQPIPNPTPTDPLSGSKILVNGDSKTTLPDADLKPGETVLFSVAVDTSASTASITNFDWFVNKEAVARQSGTSAKFQVALPDGVTTVTVVGKDAQGNVGAESVTVTIGAAPPMLMQLDGLQPNQMGVADALDRMCRDDMPTDTSGLTDDQKDALARCQAIARADPADQMRALEELSGMDFNGSRTQTLLFTKSTYSGVSDRMGALRGGARGVSLRGLNLIIDGKAIPVAELQRFIGKILGGGASADDEAGSLFGDKWGFWTRGNMTLGNKSASGADRGFKASQFSLASGLDYRLSEDTVIGTALSFGASNVAYNPIGEGGLDTKSWALTLYGTTYAVKRGYLDVALNIADSSYASHRHINYTDFLGTIDRDARGKTSGLTWSAGLSGGYDLVFKGLSISPNGSVFFTNSGIDGFRERGAGGLDLAYEDQSFDSLTGTLGLRINYALRLPFGVVLPYLRADYVRELNAKVTIFNVRFANDMDQTADPIAVQSDTPDKSYWKLSSGMSTQLPFGFSGYVEYQRLESFQFVDFQDFAFGLRMQTRF